MNPRRLVLLLMALVAITLFVPQTEASSWAYLNYSQDFVDSTSDLHTPSDVGTHNIFADLQDYGTNYDTMQEEDTSSPPTDINDYSDSSASNVDSHAGHGTLANYANMQDGDDGDYASMTEADTDTGTANIGDTSGSGTLYVTVAASTGYWGVYTSGSHSGEVTGVVFYGRGASGTINVKSVIASSSGYILTNGVSNALSVTTTAGTKTTVYSAGSRPKLSNGVTYWIGVIPSGSLRLYYDATTGGSSYYDSSNSYTTPTDPTDATLGTYVWRLMYAVQPYLEYEEDQEIQFTSVDYDETNEELCINTGTPFGTETLKVDVWYSSAWTNLGSMTTANTWYNYSVASYLTTSTFTFRFVDDDPTDDTTQDAWYIDTAVLHCWTASVTNYELDLEVGWTTADYNEGNEYLCIYPVTGSGWPTEDILVKVWSSSWVTVFSDLTPDQWNNISIASYLTDASLEVQFLGGTESSDSTQDTWTIDAVLIRTFSYTYIETVSETLSLDETVSTAVTAVFSYFETISLDEAVTTAATFSTILNEIISISASVGVAATFAINLFEEIAMSDSVALSAVFGITLFETIGLAATVETSKFMVLEVFESITVLASVSTACTFTSVLNEILTIVDEYIVPGASIIYKLIIYEVFTVSSAIPILTSYRPSIFYDLFLSNEIWGYFGPLALVIIGYFVTKKERDLGIFFVIVDSLVIATYLTLVGETPAYWWHIFILILGVIQCTIRLTDR